MLTMSHNGMASVKLTLFRRICLLIYHSHYHCILSIAVIGVCVKGNTID